MGHINRHGFNQNKHLLRVAVLTAILLTGCQGEFEAVRPQREGTNENKTTTEEVKPVAAELNPETTQPEPVLPVTEVEEVKSRSKTMNEHWQESGINFGYTAQALNNQFCYSSAKNLSACLQTLDFLAGLLPTDDHTLGRIALSETLDPKADPVILDIGVLSVSTYSVTNKIQLIKEATSRAKQWELDAQFKKERIEEIDLIQISLMTQYNQQKQNATFEGLVHFPQAVKELAKALRPHYSANFASLAAETINHLLGVAFDPHTAIQPTAKILELHQAQGQELIGVGIQYVRRNGKFIVSNVLEGTGAEVAGLQVYDQVVKVNDIELNEENANELFKGDGTVGSKIDVSFLRNGTEMQVSVALGTVVVKTFNSRIIAINHKKFGYIQWSDFMDGHLCEKFNTAVNDMASEVDGYILDLRNNPGGLLGNANCIASQFLGAGQVYMYQSPVGNSEQILKPKTTSYDAVPVLQKKPIAVLINSGSASASEIISGALQDYELAWIVGDRSYGKGTAQDLEEYPENKKISRTLTTLKFFLPSKRSNQILGVEPNFYVPYKQDATPDELFSRREADKYINPIEVKSTPWKETRPEQVAFLNSCVDDRQQKQVDSEYSKLSEIDYQLATSIDVLTCDLEAISGSKMAKVANF